MAKLKTIFFGTPDLSVPYLELLHQLTDVQLVVTQADKPRGRGMVITPCPVKQRALELNLPVLSPEKLKDDFDKIAAVPFDLGVAVAYGLAQTRYFKCTLFAPAQIARRGARPASPYPRLHAHGYFRLLDSPGYG